MAELEIRPSLWMRLRVSALIGVAGIIALALIYLLTGGGGELLAERSQITTFMPNSSGLTPKSPVRLNGILIGQVRSVGVSPSSDPRRAVRVVLEVKRQFMKSIPADSETSIRADTLVGDKFILITAGKVPASVSESGELRSEPMSQASDNADLIATLQRNLNSVDVLLKQVSSPDSQIGQLIFTDTYYQTLLARVVDFNRGVNAILAPKTPFAKAFYTLEAYRQMREPLARMDNQLAAIQRGEGQGGHFFASDEQYTRMLQSAREFRASLADANAGNGPLGKALKSDEDYRRVQELIRSTDQMIGALNAGEGQFGQLLTNPQLYEALNGALRGMQGLLQDLQSNPKKYLRAKVF